MIGGSAEGLSDWIRVLKYTRSLGTRSGLGFL
jgi:hypothetical protein